MVLKRPQASVETPLKECMFITHMLPRAWHAVRLEKTCNHTSCLYTVAETHTQLNKNPVLLRPNCLSELFSKHILHTYITWACLLDGFFPSFRIYILIIMCLGFLINADITKSNYDNKSTTKANKIIMKWLTAFLKSWKSYFTTWNMG